jgi:hypothetical protein
VPGDPKPPPCDGDDDDTDWGPFGGHHNDKDDHEDDR